MTGRKNRGSKILWAKFALPSLLAAVAAAVLWLAPSAQAQASCGSGPLNGRTQAVVDGILGKLSETDCSAVTATQLVGITGELDLSSQNLSSLQNGDFAGLSGLETLNLADNALTADLPEDVFDGLTSLRGLFLSNNALTGAMPEDLFDGLTNLHTLSLFSSGLGDQPLPEDVFDGLTSLDTLRLHSTRLAALPEGLFDGLTSLQDLELYSNSLTWLPPGLFDGLTSLRELSLFNNSSLACVHTGQFDGLTNLRKLILSGGKLGNINPAHFDRWSLDRLEELELGSDSISGSSIDFQQYKSVLPALVEGTTRVRGTDELSDPICGSIEADTDGSGFHTAVRVKLDHSAVYPNRVRASDAALLGDGHCGSDAAATRHELWTWQISDDGVTWADMASARQPPDYGTRTAGQCSYIYTPQTNDQDMYVRAYVPVNTTTGLGERDYHSAAFGPLNVQ